MAEQNGEWFADLLMKLAPDDMELTGQSPNEMISSAAKKAFAISTGAGLVPGPFGLATILPELIAVTKLQINLIYGLAKYYGKSAEFNKSTILYIFGNQAGVALGRLVVKSIAGRTALRKIGGKLVTEIAVRVGTKIGTRVAAKAVGRIVPFIFAPVFGYFSKKMTEEVGKNAIALFSGDIEWVEERQCPNGHSVDAGSKFCPECGITMGTELQ